MELKETKKMVDDVVYTLNTIEIHGEDNLNRLLGCIQVLKRISSDLDAISCAKDNPDVELKTI